MKHFTMREIEEAYAYAAEGGQGLHTHNIIVDEARAPFREFYGELVRDCVRSMNQRLDPQLVCEIEALRLVYQEARELLAAADHEDIVPYANVEALRELCVKASRARQRRGVRTVEEEG